MNFPFKSAIITAPSSIERWGGCFAENGLFIVLEVSGNNDNPAVNNGREIMDRILTNYTNQNQKNLDTVKNLIQAIKESSEVMSLVICIISGPFFYLGSIGVSEVILKRGDQVGQILSSDEFSSGKISQGDIVLVSSCSYIKITDKFFRTNLLFREDIDNIRDEGSNHLKYIKNNEGSAVLIISFEENIIPEIIASPQKIISWREKGKNKFINFFQSLRLKDEEEKESWENPEQKKSKKKLLLIAIILIILLSVSVFFNISREKSGNLMKKYTTVMELVNHQFEEANGLVELNPVRSRSLLADSKISLSEIIKDFPNKSKEHKEILDWLGKIAESEVSAYKIYKITNLPLFFDLSLIKTDGIGATIASYKEKKAVLDVRNKVIYSLATDTKQSSIVAGGDTVKEATSISVHGKNIYFFNSDGINVVDIPSKTSRVIVKTDEKWGEISAISFFGGNLYLLDKKNGRIWKYTATDNGYSERQSYLNFDVRVDLSQATKIVIDGSVWVLNRGSGILKFSRGLSEGFNFKNFSESFHDVPSISTDENAKYLYILDSAGAKVVVFDKEGVYQSQYQADELKTATDLVVSEEEKKIYVLSGSKIYGIDLR